jgi:hypothetical protein
MISVFRRRVSTMIDKGVPSFQLNEVNGLRGLHDADGGHFSISIHSHVLWNRTSMVLARRK